MDSSQQDDYGRELTHVSDSLNNHGFHVSIGGNGVARFLFVETANRAVEISRNGEKGFIEFFENEDTVQQDHVNDFQIAIQHTVNWLKK